ncbi:hypothetical protein Areg01_15160 [Actinoplanes regularis]|nr:hypothetical protein Areg01_15160 [Actinoplanes regularis]
MPEAVAAATWVWPIQRFRLPTVFPLIASTRRMPLVWAVSGLSALDAT